MGVAELSGYRLIAQFHGLEDELRGKAQGQQTVQIFRVEQEGVQIALVLLILLAVVVSQQQHVEQQLHIVLLFLLRGVGVSLRPSALARLLLYHHFLVQLEEVHASLQPQHL